FGPGDAAEARVADEGAALLGEHERVVARRALRQAVLDQLDGDRDLLGIEPAGGLDDRPHARDVARDRLAAPREGRRHRPSLRRSAAKRMCSSASPYAMPVSASIAAKPASFVRHGFAFTSMIQSSPPASTRKSIRA